MTAMDPAAIRAMRQDPHYRRFIQLLAMVEYDAAEREGTLPERWRRPADAAKGKAKERPEAA